MYGKTCLHLAIKLGNAALIDLFMSHGALSSIPDNNGQTAAHIAAKANNFEVTRVMPHFSPTRVKSNALCDHIYFQIV